MNRSMPWLMVAVLSLAVVANCVFIVRETERAVLLEFGRLKVADIQPGIHVKIPFVNEVRKFDARILTVDVRPEPFLTLEKKVVMVDSFIKWKVDNVETYYKATNGEEARVETLLSQRVNEGLRNQFGERTLDQVVSDERDQLMNVLIASLDKSVGEEIGINVIDVRVKQIELPSDVSESVYNRMRAEREREAREHRSLGRELAEGIRAAADRDKVVIESEAYRQSETLRGEGDAEAAAIYAKAYEQDPEFYAFLRSLQAYRESFASGSNLLLIGPEGDFFRYLDNKKGGK
ncbi:MAG: protease modulator HflC [Gammaproteobacteria bacterium]|nr:MAG: protease modulator HflC [Gammaproteobacteria bacterium]